MRAWTVSPAVRPSPLMGICCQEASAEGPPTVTAAGTNWHLLRYVCRPLAWRPSSAPPDAEQAGLIPFMRGHAGEQNEGGTSSPDSHSFLSGHRAERSMLRSCWAGSLVRMAFSGSEFASYSEYSDPSWCEWSKSTILGRIGAILWSSQPTLPISSSKHGFQKSALKFLRGRKY